MLDKFDSSVSKGEGCVIIRTLGSVVISRAEKAVALQIPQMIEAGKQLVEKREEGDELLGRVVDVS